MKNFLFTCSLFVIFSQHALCQGDNSPKTRAECFQIFNDKKTATEQAADAQAQSIVEAYQISIDSAISEANAQILEEQKKRDQHLEVCKTADTKALREQCAQEQQAKYQAKVDKIVSDFSAWKTTRTTKKDNDVKDVNDIKQQTIDKLKQACSDCLANASDKMNIVTDESGSWQVFPNPTKGNLTIDYYSEYSGLITIVITDISGKVCYTQSLSVEEKISQTFNLNLSNLASGIYFLQIQNGKASSFAKIIRQ